MQNYIYKKHLTWYICTYKASLVTQMVKSLLAMQQTQVWAPGKEDTLEKWDWEFNITIYLELEKKIQMSSSPDL